MHNIDPAQPIVEVAYPPTPWRMRGQAWVGMFRTAAPVAVPAGLRSLISSRWLIIALVRYLDGPLHYDELIVGPPVRCGRFVGLWIDRIWVDDLSSLWGGRRIWGLPKELARFDWEGDTVRITDAAGPVATLAVQRRASWLPPIPGAVIGIGRLGPAWTLVPARGWAWPGRSGLRLHYWSERFPYQPKPTPLLSMAANPFFATIDAPYGKMPDP